MNFEDEILNSDEIECYICQTIIGNTQAVIRHFKNVHPTMYKKYAMKVDPVLYEEEMKRDEELLK